MNGVKFGSKHSYKDWGLILKSRPVISPPSPKTIYIDVPASDGIIDLTESLTGEVKFNNRTITFEFNVIDARKRWSTIYSDILDFLHGQQMKVILDEDPNYYYVGRFKVNEWKSSKRTSTITIEGTVEPYKLELFSSTDDWEWDSFSFESGIIRDMKDMEVNEKLVLNFEGTRKSVVPTFIISSTDGTGMRIVVGGSAGGKGSYTMADGTTKNPAISFKQGYNYLEIWGNGTISIDFRGGRL